MKEWGKLNTALVIVLVLSLSMLFIENSSAITGRAIVSTTSNVTISQYLSIQMSSDLFSGIYFGDIESLPAIDQNATKNYNGTGNSSLYYISVSTDSNTNVTFCIMASGAMGNGNGDFINLENETYAFSINISDTDNPALLSDVSMTTSYVEAGDNVGIGDNLYYRFWLDVPVGQAVGTYQNSISFRGINLGTEC